MNETHPATASTRVAIECLTLWMEQDRLGAAMHITRLRHDPEGPGADGIILGLLNLSTFLVLQVAKERGATTAEELVEGARKYLRALSRDLPEYLPALSRDLPE
jgi:hypothetical protein